MSLFISDLHNYCSFPEPKTGLFETRLTLLNPGLKFNGVTIFFCFKVLSSACVLCSLILFVLKTEGQKNINRTPCYKAIKIKSKFSR